VENNLPATFNRIEDHLEQQNLLLQFFQQPTIFQELAA